MRQAGAAGDQGAAGPGPRHGGLRAPAAKVERLQAALAAATTAEEQAKIQARLDKALGQKQHAKKDKKAQQQRLAKAEGRLAACAAATP